MSEHQNRYPVAHYRWDVDKTYIHTDFDTLRSLIQTWLQRAEDKRNIPGAPALLRELLRIEGGSQVTFISGSPQQMRRVLLQKFVMDLIAQENFILIYTLRILLHIRMNTLKLLNRYKHLLHTTHHM